MGLLCEEGHRVRGSRGETGRRLLHESGPTAMVARTRVLARGAGRSEPAGHVEAQGTAARTGPGAGRGGKEAALVASCSLALHLPGLPRMAPVFPVALWTYGH